MKLKTMVLITSLIPLAVLASILAFYSFDYFNSYTKAKFNLEFERLLDVNAALFTEMQKERGKSAVYAATGHKDKSGVEAQRESTDKALANQEKVYKELEFENSVAQYKYIQDSGNIRNILNELRQNVDSKTTLKSTLSSYTGVILGLILDPLKLESKIIPESYPDLVTLKSLELAQDNAGKLRANLSSVLSKDAPIDVQKIIRISTLKGNVEANLLSPLIDKTKAIGPLIADFDKSADWAEVRSAFGMMIQKSTEGNYGWKDKNFFGTITTSVNRIVEIVRTELAIYKKDSEKAVNKAYNSFLVSMGLLGLTCLLTFGIILYMTGRIEKRILSVIHKIRSNMTQISDLSKELNQSNAQVRTNATEQAASIEQSAAALEQISTMTKSNADSADSTYNKVCESQTYLQGSKQKMQDLVEKTNQLEANRENIESLAKTVTQIGEKTDVINDIAFQTKLLSFNAAVEAERAAEHGRGFAVVAQEVGNLAKVSGNAATEISEMVRSGVSRSNSVIQSNADTTAEVSSSVIDSEETIGKALSTIEKISQMSKSIARASNEQSSGISQVNQAISNIERGTNQTVALSRQSSELSDKLEGQLTDIRSAIQLLNDLVGETTQIIENVPDTADNVVRINEKKEQSRNLKNAS